MSEQKPPVSSGLTPQAQLSRQKFEEKLNRLTQEMASVTLDIMVFGPNPHRDIPLAHKRNEVVDYLMRQNHNPMMSEELTAFHNGLSLTDAEYLQIREADWTIILMGADAPGAAGEFHDFARLNEVAHKLYIAFPEDWRSGYTGEALQEHAKEYPQNVHWYLNGEVEACNVRGKALERVKKRQAYLARFKRRTNQS